MSGTDSRGLSTELAVSFDAPRYFLRTRASGGHIRRGQRVHRRGTAREPVRRAVSFEVISECIGAVLHLRMFRAVSRKYGPCLKSLAKTSVEDVAAGETNLLRSNGHSALVVAARIRLLLAVMGPRASSVCFCSAP